MPYSKSSRCPYAFLFPDGFPALEELQNEFVIGATGRETPEILIPSTAKNRLRKEAEIETPLNNCYKRGGEMNMEMSYTDILSEML